MRAGDELMPYPFELTRVRGRNGWNSPIDLPPEICAEVRNMHFYNGALGEKRAGSTAQTLTGTAHVGYNALFHFVYLQGGAGAGLFIISNDTPYQILKSYNGTVKSALTLADNIASRPWDVSSAILNGKMYLAYDSAVNRLHVFDANFSLTQVRRVGIFTPAAPTVANTGVGAYAATLRYYKVALTRRVGVGPVLERSTLSASVSFTPSGAGTAARVTIPAIGDETSDWEIYASADNLTFYFLATQAAGTTTYDDSALVASYASGTAEPSAGFHTNWPSVKYVATDGTRLLGYGAWELTNSASDGAMEPVAGRLYFSPVLGTSGVDDDERVSNTTTIKGWIDITRNAGTIDRGLAGPLNGAFFTFQDKGITMLSPTGSATAPFRRVPLDPELGAVNNQSIVMAVDEVGRPCLYFLDPELGPYRYGAGGFQRCGKDVQDLWDTVNLDATGQVAWGLFYKSLNLVIWAVTTGANNNPDTMLVFDVTEGVLTDQDGVRNGWTVWDGDFAASRCGVMCGTLGATMGTRLLPFVGMNTGTKLLRYDTTKTQDDTTSFRGYLTTGAMTGSELPKHKQVLRSYLLAKVNTGVTITQSWTRNFGDETNRTDTVSLTAVGSETKLLKRFESPELAEAYAAQVTLGDATAAATAFTLERWWAQVEDKEYR